MIDSENIKRIIQNGESETIEFETRLISNKILEKLLLGFANTQGGKILFGIEDNGKIVGVYTSENEKRRIEDLGESLLGKKMFSIYEVNVDNKNIFVVNVEKGQKTIYSSENKIYKRVGDRTITLTSITQSNGTRVYTESGSKSYLKLLDIPETIHPGQEIIHNSITISAHEKPLKLNFLWGDDSIRVVGAHMVTPNNFEFPPSTEDISWYLKFCASQEIRIECDKQVYVNVEEINENKKIVKIAKWVGYSLIALSFLPLIINFIQIFFNESYQVNLNFWGISVPIPIATIFSFVLLNRRITRIITNLSNIQLTSNTKFIEKGISNPNELVIRSLRIRFDSGLRNYENYASHHH